MPRRSPSATRRARTRDSAGILIYRGEGAELEVLLVHPAGWYNKKAPWSIPKGLPEEDESLEQAAIRETLEETGVTAEGPLASLEFVTYKGGKRVHGFCVACPPSAAQCCASWEVDQAESIPISRARQLLHASQRELLDRLERHAGTASPGPAAYYAAWACRER